MAHRPYLHRYYYHADQPQPIVAAWQGGTFPGSRVHAEVSGVGDYVETGTEPPVERPLSSIIKKPGLFGILVAGAMAYHGYRRNKSVGWAIGWSILGSTFPIVAIPVALAQGFGKPREGRGKK